jgi:ubiquinone/menaquinone biosynthesis C-methylase UbiE
MTAGSPGSRAADGARKDAMTDANDVSSHYTRGDLLTRLNAALSADGADPGRPTPEALAPYDHFHGRGLEATIEIADLMPVRGGDHLLDIGSGIGGPARYVATRFGCRVTGIDLTPEFVEVARHLTRLAGLDDRVRFETGDALAMPFGDATFAGAYSMNVSMNIEDKAAFYGAIRRVLAPGGWLLLSEIARGDGGEPDYPTPWAAHARTSFLSTPEETRAGLRDAGFDVVELRSSAEAARAMVARGEKPPHRGVMLVHGEMAGDATANSSRALHDGRIVPIEVLATKRG